MSASQKSEDVEGKDSEIVLLRLTKTEAEEVLKLIKEINRKKTA